jgi:hypothetical protein
VVALAVLLCLAGGAVTARGGRMQPGDVFQLMGTPPQARTISVPATEVVPGDLLQFLDGATLHGALQGMDAGLGLRWRHPDATKAFDLQPAHVDFLRFSHAQPVTNSPNCHFRFFSGDELFGSLVSMNDENLELTTWFGGALKTPRGAVQTISFLPKSYSVVYEGPSDASGWVVGGQQGQRIVMQGANGLPGNVVILNGGVLVMNGIRYGGTPNPTTNWLFRDASFVSAGFGTLGRDFHLSGSSTLEFDVTCRGNFNLCVQLYTSTFDGMNLNNGSFLIDLDDNPNATLRGRSMLGNANDLGNVLLPSLLKLGRAHITVHCNHAQGVITVLVDGEVARSWTDLTNLKNSQGGVLFQSQSSDSMQLSNIKVSQWKGNYEPVLASPSFTNTDEASFINLDKAYGKIESIAQGKLQMNIGGNLLPIPLERVRQINFAPSAAPAAQPGGPWVVRANFTDGASVSFQLDKWVDSAVSGRSALFGPVLFPSHVIREMDFNLDRPKVAPAPLQENEFEALDR